MPAYNPSILISDCYGSAGSITFYHRDGKCRWRRRSSLSFTGTPAQCTALSVHRRALAAWRTIPDTEKERWHDIAKNVPPRRPPFGSGGHISGHNLFVSAYHGFVTLGDEHIPEPVEHRPFPVFAAEFVSPALQSPADGSRKRLQPRKDAELPCRGGDGGRYGNRLRSIKACHSENPNLHLIS